MIIAILTAVAGVTAVCVGAFLLTLALSHPAGMSGWAYARKALVWTLTGESWDRNPRNPACR